MAIKNMRKSIEALIRKYKYPLIVLSVGVLLLILPGLFESHESGKEYIQITETAQKDLCSDIEALLAKVSGVGKVRVLLSVAASETSIYQTDERITQSTDNSTVQSTTIITSDAERVQDGLVKQIIAETYRGAIIVCEGADNPTVRLAVVEAVCKITGLNSNQISVMKMK